MGAISRQLVSEKEAAMLLGVTVPEARLLLRQCGVVAEECGGQAWYEARAVCQCAAEPNGGKPRRRPAAGDTNTAETTGPA